MRVRFAIDGGDVKNGLTIALAISLVLGVGALWGSCAVPHPVSSLTSPISEPPSLPHDEWTG